MSVQMAQGGGDQLGDLSDMSLHRRMSLSRRRSKRMSQLSGDTLSMRDSFTAQLSLLTHLRTPNGELETILNQVPNRESRIEGLLEKFFMAEKEVIQWIQEARIALIALQAEDPEVLVATTPLGQDPEKEVEKVISHFAPQVKAFAGLRDLILKLVQTEDEQEDVQETADRAISQWDDVKMQLESLKMSFVNIKQDRNAAEEIEELMEEISDITSRIFEVQEQRHLASFTALEKDATPATAAAASPHEAALVELDAQIDALTPRIDTISSHITGLQSPAITAKYQELMEQWNCAKHDVLTLGDELKEDKWLVVFRTVGEQADSMIDSLERAIAQCQQYTYRSLHKGCHLADDWVPMTRSSYAGLVKSFDAKRKYYVPAVDRVMSILERGIQDRVTKNGEVLKRYHDMRARWSRVKEQTNGMEAEMASVEDLAAAGALTSSPTSSTTSSPPVTPSRGFSPSPSRRREMSPLRRMASALQLGARPASPTQSLEQTLSSVSSISSQGHHRTGSFGSPDSITSPRTRSPRPPLSGRPAWNDSKRVQHEDPKPMNRELRNPLSPSRSPNRSVSPSSDGTAATPTKAIPIPRKAAAAVAPSTTPGKHASHLPRPTSVHMSTSVPSSSYLSNYSPSGSSTKSNLANRLSRALSPVRDMMNGTSSSGQLRNVRNLQRHERPATPEYAIHSRARGITSAFHTPPARGTKAMSPSSNSSTPSSSNVGRYNADRTDEVDIAVAKVINGFMDMGMNIPVERRDGHKYIFYGRANNRPLNVKVTDFWGPKKGAEKGTHLAEQKLQKVMVKLGGLMGGYVDLEMWLLNNK